MTTDRLSGAFLVFLGLFVIWERRVLPLGTHSQPGAGYFPLFLALLLIILGGVLFLRGRLSRAFRSISWSEAPHALAILGCCVFVTLFMEPIGRGTILGFLIGIIPGSAHIISTFVAYAIERKLSRHPERFGQGAIEGVAGPESANNAASEGALVPMLALGVPTGPIPAVLLAALMVHGINPGPLFIKDQPAIFWGLIASMYVGNMVLLLLNLPLVGLFVNFLRIPYRILYPTILMFCIVGFTP